MATSKARLESALPLVRSYEGERARLVEWVKGVLRELTEQGPLPADPHAVQELKQKIDVRASTASYMYLL